MSGRILHVCNTDKFIPGFIRFVQHHFDARRHHFWLMGDHTRYPVADGVDPDHAVIDRVHNSAAGHLAGYLRLIVLAQRCEKIILHGLSRKKLEKLFWAMPWVLPKCYWIIWGSDLYAYRKKDESAARKRREFFRRPVIRRMGHLVTFLEGDVALARQWYGARGRYHECLVYPSNLFEPTPPTTDASGTCHLLLGNSADPANCHFELLERLAPFAGEDLRLYVPLSYGSATHAESVIDKGRALFGEKFIPLTEFMPLEQYAALLHRMDIAIFGHHRQQAMGNAIKLLGMGKKVYLRQGVAQRHLFERLGILCFDIDNFSTARLDPTVAARHHDIIASWFSERKLRAQLERVFDH